MCVYPYGLRFSLYVCLDLCVARVGVCMHVASVRIHDACVHVCVGDHIHACPCMLVFVYRCACMPLYGDGSVLLDACMCVRPPCV